MTHMNHDEPYSAVYLQDILESVQTIAMVGASPDKTKLAMVFCACCTKLAMT